jgi:hypothetical protein
MHSSEKGRGNDPNRREWLVKAAAATTIVSLPVSVYLATRDTPGIKKPPAPDPPKLSYLFQGHIPLGTLPSSAPEGWVLSFPPSRQFEVLLYERAGEVGRCKIQFMGEIQKSALRWVLRYQDHRNFTKWRILLSRQGPILEYQTVIEGKELPPEKKPLVSKIAVNRPFPVEIRCEANRIFIDLEDDTLHWDEPRLHTGKVGFYSAKNEEEAHVYSMEVTPG